MKYVIGDIQGCFESLQELLALIEFDAKKDILWFTGDLVNRGPQSLETLRFIKDLGPQHKTVLGNHDLHLLAIAYHAQIPFPGDTLTAILEAPDRDELMQWLIQQPLLHQEDGFTLIHAGLAPSWDLMTAKKLAKEIETILQSADAVDFFKNMYGDTPNFWDDKLEGWERLRSITNFLTRARFCNAQGYLELNKKGKLNSANELFPWFKVPHRKTINDNIIFGHWAALGGVTNTPHVYALDTGCIWGYSLTAMCLDSQEYFQVSCQKL